MDDSKRNLIALDYCMISIVGDGWLRDKPTTKSLDFHAQRVITLFEEHVIRRRRWLFLDPS